MISVIQWSPDVDGEMHAAEVTYASAPEGAWHTTAGLLILLGLCLVTDFRRSVGWLGQHAKENASVL